jgi:hypothetical protein
VKIYLRNKATGRQFEVIKVDRERNVLIIKGTVSTYEEPNDKDRLKRLGYELVKG